MCLEKFWVPVRTKLKCNCWIMSNLMCLIRTSLLQRIVFQQITIYSLRKKETTFRFRKLAVQVQIFLRAKDESQLPKKTLNLWIYILLTVLAILLSQLKKTQNHSRFLKFKGKSCVIRFRRLGFLTEIWKRKLWIHCIKKFQENKKELMEYQTKLVYLK